MSPCPALLAVAVLTAPASEEPAYSYEVSAGPEARVLEVSARFVPGSGGVLVLERGLLDFVDGAEIEAHGAWRRLERSGAALLAPECEGLGCRIRYRFRLAPAAREVRDLHRALEHEGALLAPPSSWLLRPLRATSGRFRFSVRTAPGTSFVSGVLPVPGLAGAYEADIACFDSAAYSGFGAFDTVRFDVPGGGAELAIAPGERQLDDAALRLWAEQAAGAVSGYFGRLPVPRVLILVLPGGRRPVGFGSMLGSGGASVMIFVGRQAGDQDLARDWVLTHELTHLGFPDLGAAPSWIEEGLATYLEPLARARVGLLSEAAAWGELVEGLPRGLPGRGDAGLDAAQGFRRIYWGGALYWLLCDLELRERTGNARGLQDVLRKLVAAGGNGSVSWSLERALDELERAAGERVFRERLRRMGSEPVRVDLAALWKWLGIARGAGGVAFDESAPLSTIRRSLTAR